MPPEINDSEIYWIHPDHLGSSSVLTNSNGEISNWYEYMPCGEPLMELTTGQYNNPYKYNGKETDSQTGLHYYGARYYDSQRSFWLLVEILRLRKQCHLMHIHIIILSILLILMDVNL